MTAIARSFLVRGLVGLFVGALLMLLAIHYCVPAVHADPLASAPVAHAVTTAQSGWDVVETYGPIWGAMLLVYGLASAFLAKNESAHWIAQGRMLALVVAGVGLLGAVLEAELGGASWSGVIVTLVGAVKMVISPTVAKPPDGQTQQTKGATGTQLSVMLVLLMASAPLLIGGVS